MEFPGRTGLNTVTKTKTVTKTVTGPSLPLCLGRVSLSRRLGPSEGGQPSRIKDPPQFFDSHLENREAVLHRPGSQKTRARGEARLADQAQGEGKSSYLEFAVTH